MGTAKGQKGRKTVFFLKKRNNWGWARGTINYVVSLSATHGAAIERTRVSIKELGPLPRRVVGAGGVGVVWCGGPESSNHAARATSDRIRAVHVGFVGLEHYISTTHNQLTLTNGEREGGENQPLD